MQPIHHTAPCTTPLRKDTACRERTHTHIHEHTTSIKARSRILESARHSTVHPFAIMHHPSSVNSEKIAWSPSLLPYYVLSKQLQNCPHPQELCWPWHACEPNHNAATKHSATQNLEHATKIDCISTNTNSNIAPMVCGDHVSIATVASQRLHRTTTACVQHQAQHAARSTAHYQA